MHYPSSIVRHSSLGYIKTDPLLLVTVHGHENGSLVIDESNLSISVISADGTIILPSMRYYTCFQRYDWLRNRMDGN
jgi:hypothetical protein